MIMLGQPKQNMCRSAKVWVDHAVNLLLIIRQLIMNYFIVRLFIKSQVIAIHVIVVLVWPRGKQ